MLTAAERGILIYPSEKVRKAHPEFPVAKDHNDLRAKTLRKAVHHVLFLSYYVTVCKIM